MAKSKLSKLDQLDLEGLNALLEAQKNEFETMVREAAENATLREELASKLQLIKATHADYTEQLNRLEELGAPKAKIDKVSNALEQIGELKANIVTQLDHINGEDNPPETEGDGKGASGTAEPDKEGQSEGIAPERMDPLVPAIEALGDVPKHLLRDGPYLAAAFYAKCRMLSDHHESFTVSELCNELNLVAAVGRLLQDEIPALAQSESAGHPEMRKGFSILGNISKEVQHECPALNRRYTAEWTTTLNKAVRQREALYAKRVEQAEKERMEAEVAANRAAIRDRLLVEFDELLLANQGSEVGDVEHANDSDNGSAEVVDDDDIKEMLVDLLQYDVTTDEAFLGKIEPYEAILQGSAFRGLRRALQRRREPKKGEAKAKPAKKASKPAKKAKAEVKKLPVTQMLQSKKVLILGGVPRTERRDAMHAAFKTDTLDWFDPQDVPNLEMWLNQGRYDVVFVLLRFSPHWASDTARNGCKENNLIYVPISHGYGIQTLSRAYETTASKLESGE